MKKLMLLLFCMALLVSGIGCGEKEKTETPAAGQPGEVADETRMDSAMVDSAAMDTVAMEEHATDSM